MFGFGKDQSHTKIDAAEKPQRWCTFRRKMLVLVGVVLVLVIGLAVGLGVGLTRGKGSGGDDDGSDDGSHNKSNNTDVPTSGPNRTEIWKPKPNTSWQIILRYPADISSSSVVSPDVDVYDLDLFDNHISTFKTLQDSGKKVICYFSAGSYEDWREDKGEWDDKDLGKGLEGWAGEKWVNVSSPSVHKVMKERINLAWRKGCDAIDPDNVDGYQNDNGLGLTEQDSVNYMKFLSEEAGKYNMSIGLKNAGDIISEVIDVIHFSVNEQCIQYSECKTFSAFIDADKPVFNIEYPDSAPSVATTDKDEICSKKGKADGTDGFSIVIKKMNLDGWVEYCDGKTYETKVNNTSSS
ncbi:unnamed protein product [Clonostachys byssicola]|uniref:alpha-galactosidase n=1 Tax=Clonostachys byssicola TaxID=160290 RepID=A0A9N9UZ54_9HYPO|nr:unnamed protein product [Clonostachys byssicola]